MITKNINLRDNLKRLSVTILTAAVLMSNTMPIYALSKPIVKFSNNQDRISKETSSLQNEIIRSTRLLESVMKKSYEKAQYDVEQTIVRKNYHYEMTMESFYEQGNPFKDYDYIKLIAIYATIKDHSNVVGINNVDFVKAKIEETEMDEYKPVKIDNYTKNDNGYYEKNGKRSIGFPTSVKTYALTPKGYIESGEQQITPGTVSHKYGIVTFKVLDYEDLFKIFNVKLTDEIKSEYKHRISIINQTINGTGLSQSVFLNIHKSNVVSQADLENVALAEESQSENRKAIMNTALSLIGNVPYEWGGKSEKSGYDTSWWTFKENGKQKGLDCSGFVQWVYRTAGFSEELWNKMLSTSIILNSFESESKNELEVGDLGLLNNGEKTNHVGIYMGNGYWVHCSSSKSTVVVEKDFPFTIFKKVPKVDQYYIDTVIKMVYYTDMINVHENDVYLLSQLITHEALGEGLNGWVAATEVVKNRIASDKFPNTVEEVVFQKDPETGKEQFQDVDAIRNITPSEEMMSIVRETMAGNMAIINNPDVLFFKNAKGETDDWGHYPFFTTIGRHTFYTIQ